MVGEMRDDETAAIAIEASLTGHLVLSTLHTNSAAETVTRLLDMGLDPYAFSDSLLCILAQRLAKKLCTSCREQYIPDEAELDKLLYEFGEGMPAEMLEELMPEEVVLYRAKGCHKCENTGYSGRFAIHEMLECTDGIKELVRQRTPSDRIKKHALSDGMKTLRMDGLTKILQGITDTREVRRVTLK